MTDNRDIGNAQISDMTNTVKDIEVSARDTDGAFAQDETEWQNTKWTTYYGYYLSIPELKQAIDTRKTWTLGAGWTSPVVADEVTFEGISGNGTQTFNQVLGDMIIIRRINGDSYSEIIDDANGNLRNLKPLNPGRVKIVFGKNGILKRYEYNNSDGSWVKIAKEKMFHLVNKKVADSIHGISDIEVVEKIIAARNEGFDLMRRIMRRFVEPKFLAEVDHSDPVKIKAFMNLIDESVNTGNHIGYPKGSMKLDLLAVPSNATLNPLPWFNHLKDYFFQVVGIPQIIMGSSGEFTESTAKIAFTAFEQSVKEEQRDIEEQIWRQLHKRIELNVAVTLRNELITDTAKDGANQAMGIQPNDVTVGVGE